MPGIFAIMAQPARTMRLGVIGGITSRFSYRYCG